MAQYDYLIAGSGLFGSVFAHKAAAAGKKVLVIDKRPHPGGNVSCASAGGITVHSYGPHIFHTASEEIWRFANSFVPFDRYIHSPVANYKGRIYSLPFTMNTFCQLWGAISPEEARAKIAAQRGEPGPGGPGNLEEQAIALVGADAYEILIKGYTEKQWGRKCADLPAFIIRRLPVRFTFGSNYFDDPFQGIPRGGYNPLIEGLLEGTETRCNADFFDGRPYWESLADRIVFTGGIDRFYGCRFGALEYRSLRFDTRILDTRDYQGCAVVNYTAADVPYTRVIEHKHFGGASGPKTAVTWEYPLEWREGAEPFYPVNDAKNSALYARYRALADRERKVIFGGRLAEYTYYDMDGVIASALRAWGRCNG
jgi:UDP-galactopyranose mutase